MLCALHRMYSSKGKESHCVIEKMGMGAVQLPRLKTITLLVLIAFVAKPTASIGGAFDLRDFGAKSDGVSDNSKAFLSAWQKACQWNAKARVLIPEGTFLVGPTLFQGPCKGPIVVQVKGSVKAPPNLKKFTSDSWLVFQSVDGLMITGGGAFDGQGASSWPQNKCPNTIKCKLLPTSLRFNFVTNLTIRRISSVDSKFFHINIFGSQNLKLQALNIKAPANSPNTDGIHIGTSSNVKISRSVIATGDDCISIGPGSTNISISNVFCGPGHGISVGSLGKYEKEEDVVGLTVRNCTFSNTTNGVRIKTWPGSPPSQASNLTFEDIIMENVYNPIIIDQEYCPFNSCPQKPPSHVRISNVRFKDIRGTSASQVAINLLCSKDVPCQKVELQDIKLEYSAKGAKERTSSISSCSNAIGSSFGTQIPPSCL